MAEFTNVAAQTVAANGNVVFSNTAVKVLISFNTGREVESLR